MIVGTQVFLVFVIAGSLLTLVIGAGAGSSGSTMLTALVLLVISSTGLCVLLLLEAVVKCLDRLAALADDPSA